jgi:ribosome-associated protein
VARNAANRYLDDALKRTDIEPDTTKLESNRDTRKGSKPLSTHVISRAARRSPAVSQRPSAKETLHLILDCLDDMKAEDSVTIDLTGKSSIGDYMIVTTGRSQRHVGAVADNVVREMAGAGIRGVRVEGMPQCDWVLIDAGDVIVHVFRPESRAFYGLEKMWSPGRGPRQSG